MGVRGISTNFGFGKVSQIDATRSRHVSRSGSSVVRVIFSLVCFFFIFFIIIITVFCRLLTVQMTWSTRAGAARVDRMWNSRRILSFCR